MAENDQKRFIALSSKTKLGAIAAAGIVVAVLVAAFYGVSWQIGNMLAELTPSTQANAAEVAAVAAALDPSDPMTRWLVATKEKDKFNPESIDRAAVLFADVVRSSPNDFRWWVELGRSYEQAERIDVAEAAFGKAIELAPNYAYPRWQIGNFYLRQNRVDEAFAQLKKATEGSAAQREQVFSLAWDYFGKDPSKLESVVGDTADVKVSLALFYAVRNNPADALRIWNQLSAIDKERNPVVAKSIAQGFFDKRFFRESLEFSRQVGRDPSARPEVIGNGGFEEAVGLDDSLYGWRVVRNDGKLDIATDSQTKNSGARSIRLVFRGYAKADLYNISQIIVVSPGQKYRISAWVKTENLRSGGGPRLEVLNAADSTLLTSLPIGSDTNDWRQVNIDVTVPDNTTAIEVRTGRAFCGECPIFGTLWYDDFSISKL